MSQVLRGLAHAQIRLDLVTRRLHSSLAKINRPETRRVVRRMGRSSKFWRSAHSSKVSMLIRISRSTDVMAALNGWCGESLLNE